MQRSSLPCLLTATAVLTTLTPLMGGDTVQLGSAFHYQAQLKSNGVPVTDVCHFRFGLWTSPEFIFGLLGSVDVDNVQVTNGLVDLEVDFGFEAFDGTDRWLEVAVACPGGATFFDYTTLEPRQHISATPYAMQTRGILVNDAGDVGIGINGSAQRMTVEKFSGRVGVNTKAPLTRFHLIESAISLSSSAIRDDDLVVEDGDAVLGLYSNSSGSTGSMLSLKEISAGSMTDNWTIWRGSSNGDSALHFSYGSEPAGTLNPSMLTLAPGGDVGIGTADPNAALHVVGDNGVLIEDTSGVPLLSVRGDGRIGMGSNVPFNARLHVRSDDLGIAGPVFNNDDIVIESQDAVLGLYSKGAPDGGNAGSAVSLKEISQGAMIDQWGIYRETQAAGSSLLFTYGAGINYASNPVVLELSDQSGASITGDLHVQGAITATGQRTGFYSIPTVGFEMISARSCCGDPQYYPSQFDVDGLAVWHSSSFRPSGQIYRFGAPLYLPHGAHITAFHATVFDDAPGENIAVRLVRNLLDENTPATIASISSSGEPDTTVLKKTLSPSLVIDNSKFAYWIRAEWISPGDGNGTIRLGPARVEYTAEFP